MTTLYPKHSFTVGWGCSILIHDCLLELRMQEVRIDAHNSKLQVQLVHGALLPPTANDIWFERKNTDRGFSWATYYGITPAKNMLEATEPQYKREV